MENNIFELEKEYLNKLSNIQSEFDNKIIDLKKEFTQKVNSFLLNEKPNIEVKKPIYVEPIIDNLFYLHNYSIIKELKSEYNKRFHYSFNILTQYYLECYRNNKRKGYIRWFKQLLVHYPNEINKFLTFNKTELFEGYRDILYNFGFTEHT